MLEHEGRQSGSVGISRRGDQLPSLQGIYGLIDGSGLAIGWRIKPKKDRITLTFRQLPSRQEITGFAKIEIWPNAISFISVNVPSQAHERVAVLARLMWGEGSTVITTGKANFRLALRERGFAVINENISVRIWRGISRRPAVAKPRLG